MQSYFLLGVLLLSATFNSNALETGDGSLPAAEVAAPTPPPVVIPTYTNVAVEGDLPEDKTFDDLTEGQKSALRSEYENLPETDEPPYPFGGIRSITDPIRQTALLSGVDGHFSAITYVDAKGDVQKLDVLKTPSADATRSIGSIIFKTRFKPAICGGEACAMEFQIRLVLKETYYQSIQKLIQSKIQYPLSITKHRATGSSRVRVKFRRDGTILDVSVVEKSDELILDTESREVFKRIGRFPAVPSDIQGDSFVIEVPVTFEVN